MYKFFRYITLLVFILNPIYAQCNGDSNLDDSINIQDIILIVNHILEDITLDGAALSNSDTNDDQEVDILDIIVIVNIILLGDSECELTIDLSLDWEVQDDLSYFNFAELENIIDNQIGQLDDLRGILIIHNGKIVKEDYYSVYSENSLYNIWSVTKSYTSTLIGQAIDQGFIDDENVTLNQLLPDYGQPYLESLTLDNLLTMSSGYYDGFGYPAWVSATTQQLVWMPYTFPGVFFYNNSACHLNSHILYYSTGMIPEEFAEINLFPYLGIENPQWFSGYNNINDGSASLVLNLRDMVKLGQLYLQDGYSGDNQILSSEWIQEATSPQISTGVPSLPNYGYLWWLFPEEGYLAYGYGGQFIAVFPERNLVVGTHSYMNSTVTYQNQVLDYIYNDIAPLFDNN